MTTTTTTTIARWETRGNDWLELIRTKTEEYSYSGQGCGGVFNAANDAECLQVAAFEAESNARQYSPFEFFARDCNEDENRADGLWEAYERGIAVGIRSGLKTRLASLTQLTTP